MQTPNIVVFLLDAARSDHFSCYGYDRTTTPFIDHLARSGDLYSQAYSQSIWSLPAYASLFTGEYPSTHGAVDWGQSINSESNKLVGDLKEEGYETYAVTTHLLNCGYGISDAFDETVWVEKSNRLPHPDDPVYEFVQGKIDSGEFSKKSFPRALKIFLQEQSWETIPNAITYALREWKNRTGRWEDDGAEEIIGRAKEIVDNASRPFFLFTNFVETHDSYRPPQSFIHEYLPEAVTIEEANKVAQKHLVDLTLERESLTDREREIIIALYDAEIRYVDSKIKEFVKFLEEQNEIQNTVFVICADHGDLFGEWGVYAHQAVIHRDLCRVPLIISTPWGEGERYNQPVELRQLAEYLPDIAAGKQDPLSPQRRAIVEYHGWDCQISDEQWTKLSSEEQSQWGAYSASCFTKEWQLLVNANGNQFLYNQKDVSSRIDSSITDEDISRKLSKEIYDILCDPEVIHEEYRNQLSSKDPIEEVDSEVRQHLKDLGYA